MTVPRPLTRGELGLVRLWLDCFADDRVNIDLARRLLATIDQRDQTLADRAAIDDLLTAPTENRP